MAGFLRTSGRDSDPEPVQVRASAGRGQLVVVQAALHREGQPHLPGRLRLPALQDLLHARRARRERKGEDRGKSSNR